jgi:hypothetical protein
MTEATHGPSAADLDTLGVGAAAEHRNVQPGEGWQRYTDVGISVRRGFDAVIE